ncbi:MAG: 5-formyltetrahydrofolate cyclo-ligase [Gammaproteobacteria bacterium]|nr:5-formyltetrahydrofolate cyclo-ligase [Gammaproteobacteria bacterium]
MSLSKKELREHFKKIRSHLTQNKIIAWSSQIYNHILELPSFINAQNIGLYMPMQHEVQIQALLKQPKNKYLPIVQSDMHLEFYLYDKRQPLIQNQWNIEEPSPLQPHIDIHQLDVIFIPMLAFDLTGQRLGMGKGCYDRTLQNCSIQKIGLAFDIQEYTSIPHDSYDISLNMLITEKRILTF